MDLINMRKLIPIILFYLIGICLLYPLVAGILMYDYDILKDKLPYGYFCKMTAIFFGHLVLLIIGSILLTYRKYNFMHALFGVFFIVCGIYWFYRVINAYMQGGYG